MKKTFIIATLVITGIVTIVMVVNATDTFSYALSGRIDASVFIVPVVGIMFAILLAVIPDDENRKS